MAHMAARSRVLASGFGLDLVLDRLEIHKPGFENGLGHLLQGLVDLAVEFDFIVYGRQEYLLFFLLIQ